MNSSRSFKKYLAVLFSSTYLFAFLFAANIHDHDAGYFYKEFNLKTSSKNFSKQSKINNADGCLSCHFASSPIILPDSFTLEISEFNSKKIQFSIGNYQVSKTSQLQNYLRGPPVFI